MMPDFKNTIDLLGDDEVTKSLILRTITELRDNVITAVGDCALRYCTALETVDLPLAESVGTYAFSGCEKLKSVNLPNLYSGSSYDSYVFFNCKALTGVNIPRAPVLYSNYFSGCSSLAFLDLPKVYKLMSNCVVSCTSLKTIALRNETVCTLDNASIFYNTPFASGKAGGTLLVPRSLVESYKTATNWSVIWGYGHNRFLALEDYTVDGTITGEIDWDKLGGTT